MRRLILLGAIAGLVFAADPIVKHPRELRFSERAFTPPRAADYQHKLSNGATAFDYHGYSDVRKLMWHTQTKASRWWPGWTNELIALPPDVLVSEPKSKQYDGLWLREPGQFLHDALPRARAFLARFASPGH